MLLRALLPSLLVVPACGGFVLDRLEGEPTTTHPFTESVSQRTHPAIDGVQRFVVAVRRGESEAAYAQLSADTRKALQARAQEAGVRGIDLLIQGKLPVGDSMAGAIAADPLRLFALDDLDALQLVEAPPSASIGPGGAKVAVDPKAITQHVRLVGKSGRERTVEVRFEGYGWRLHHPSLALPGAGS
ncbi:MAG: hypothetical protein EXR79_07500 [Myxococcales bacterium]|nr:hypothetical protein [Myxococcales bacterium]